MRACSPAHARLPIFRAGGYEPRGPWCGQTTSPHPMASTPATADATVLVVDDDDANRSLARHTLEDEGYRVVLASGGEEAIAAALREAPDCIVLDVRMPDVDGFSVCERIRSLPQAAGTPVLFLTASRDVETFDRAL